MNTYRTNNVFVPGGQPEHTYVSRNELQLEDRLLDASDNLCKLVTLTGPTKCGKSVVAQRIYPRNEHLWVDGGSVESESDIWEQIVDQAGLFTSQANSSTDSSSTGSTEESSLGGGLGSWFTASHNTGGTSGSQKGRSVTRARNSSSKASAIKSLHNCSRTLVIDDFHYLERDVQANVIRALKAPIASGQPVIVIAIPHRRYDAVRVEKEMTGRVESISIDYWSKEELRSIPMTGFPLLNIDIDDSIVNTFVEECLQSPHLIQEFCRRLCRLNGISETCSHNTRLAFESSGLHSIFKGVATDTSKAIFDRLAKGPRQRSDRIQRQFRDGRKADLYVVVLHAIASLKPTTTTIEYEQLRSSLRELLRELPQAHEVSRVLEHMSNIQADEASSAPVLDWEKEERRLHIVDPFFAFFLRWGTELQDEYVTEG